MHIKFNLISGSLASMGGVLTKIAFSFGKDGVIDQQVMPYVVPILQDETYILIIKGIIHLMFMALAVTNSGLMYTYYIKSMQINGAAKATVYNFAINYIGSIIFGFMFFAEAVTQRLLFGVILILSGTYLISSCEEEEIEI